MHAANHKSIGSKRQRYFFFNTQRSFSQATLAIVMPLTSHLESPDPHTESQGVGEGLEAGTALHVQQSEKMVQSSTFLHSGPVDTSGSGLASDFDPVSDWGAVCSCAFESPAAGACSALSEAADSGALLEPPHAASSSPETKIPIR